MSVSGRSLRKGLLQRNPILLRALAQARVLRKLRQDLREMPSRLLAPAESLEDLHVGIVVLRLVWAKRDCLLRLRQRLLRATEARREQPGQIVVGEVEGAVQLHCVCERGRRAVRVAEPVLRHAAIEVDLCNVIEVGRRQDGERFFPAPLPLQIARLQNRSLRRAGQAGACALT